MRLLWFLIVLGLAPVGWPLAAASSEVHSARFQLLEESEIAQATTHDGAHVGPVVISVQVTGPLVQADEPAVIVGSPALARRLIPLKRQVGHELAATVRLELGKGTDVSRRTAVPIEFTFVRLGKLTLTPVFTRTAYVMIGQSPASGPSPAVPLPDVPALQSKGEESPRPIPSDGIREEPLVQVSALSQGPAYWHDIERRIRRAWREQSVPYRKPGGRRSVGVQFRLSATGEVQLVQINKTSGDAFLDAAALQAVVTAEPFPSRHDGAPAPPVDVHIELREGNR